MSKLNWWKTAYAVFLVCAATAIASTAQTFTTLTSFDVTDGAYPVAGLVQATDGNFYGTTNAGGAGNNGGTVFKITTDGTLTTLYSFCQQSGCTDGVNPFTGLVQGTDGNFYGTTYYGGANNSSLCSNLGCGAIFKIAPNGTMTTLCSFCSQSDCTDGALPGRALVQGTDGNFYGITETGGAGDCSLAAAGAVCGTIFKVTPSGKLTTLYDFCSQSDCTDGYGPDGPLVQATDGSFYGTTALGGAIGTCGGAGCGTVFKVTPSGTLTTLYDFCSRTGCTDGALPAAGLIQATDGDFYGTTAADGLYLSGTVFKITPGGMLKTLYSFCSVASCADGGSPEAGLVQATDGNFYGTTYVGGSHQGGTIFRITANGRLTRLYSFCSQDGCVDGANPFLGALTQDTNGNFYGTTEYGGTSSACGRGGCGTIFSLSVGLGPFVETEPSGGKVGAAVKILGTNLTGATSVTFNGTPAAFTVEASSVIKATVPAGATTGTVQVVTPGGTLSSNVPFRVVQ